MIWHQYIRRQCLLSLVVWVMSLLFFMGMLEWVLQLAHISAQYTMTHAVRYAWALLPRNLYQAMPWVMIASVLFTYARLQKTGEWLGMLASGMSIDAMRLSCMQVVLGACLFFVVLGEGVAPDLTYYAKQQKPHAVHQNKGVWWQDGHAVWYANHLRGRHLYHVIRYQVIDPPQEISYAPHLYYAQGVWRGHGHAIVLKKGQVVPRLMQDDAWPLSLSVRQLAHRFQPTKLDWHVLWGEGWLPVVRYGIYHRLLQPWYIIWLSYLVLLSLPRSARPLSKREYGYALAMGVVSLPVPASWVMGFGVSCCLWVPMMIYAWVHRRLLNKRSA